MGICNIPIKTDLKNKSYTTSQACKQNDTLILEFDIFDNSIMADLTGFICDLRANKADGKGYQIISGVTVTVATGKSTIQCPSSLTQFAGLLKLELTFTNSANGLQKTTFDIVINVDKSTIANDDGTVPTVIITALEELNENLSQISGKVAEAQAINNTLTNTKNAADNSNSTLNTAISNANTAKTNCDTATGNLNTVINVANGTIVELEQTNSQYTSHINNADIHLTLEEKKNVKLIPDIVHLIDILTTGISVTDENGTVTTDENNVPWTV